MTVTAFIWGNYGRLVEKPAVSAVVCIVVLAINIGLILGSEMWAVPLATDISKLWIDPASQVAANNKHVETFGSTVDTSSNELITLGDVDGSNMLTPEGFGKFAEYMDRVLNTVAFHNGTAFTILDVCNGRNGQVPYAFGCGINSPIDYFREGKEYFPLDAAAQWMLEEKLTGPELASSLIGRYKLWTWAISADLVSSAVGGSISFFNNWFSADCMLNKRLLCASSHNAQLITNVNTLIGTQAFPQLPKLQFSWIKAHLALSAVVSGLATGPGPGTCSTSPGTNLVNTVTPAIVLQGKVTPTTLGTLQALGYVDNLPHTMDACSHGPSFASCGAATTCDITSLSNLQPLNFGSPCATCVISMMYWMGELNVTAQIPPTGSMPTGALSLSNFQVYNTSDYEAGRAVGNGLAVLAANGLSSQSVCTVIPAGTVTSSQCASLWDQFYTATTAGLAGNLIAAKATIDPRVQILVTLPELPEAALLRTNPGLGGSRAAMNAAWKALLVSGAVSDAVPVLLRHSTRPSYVGKDTAALGVTLSGFKNDLLAQNLRAAIFGSAEPHPGSIRAGKCACTAGYSGLQCSVTGIDPICDCDTTLKPTCLQGLMGSCLPIAACAGFKTIVSLVANAGALGIPPAALAAYTNFANDMAVGAAFAVNSNVATGVLLLHCGSFLPCVDSATLYSDPAFNFTTMGPVGYAGILEDASWNAALLQDFLTSNFVGGVLMYENRAKLLYSLMKGTYQAVFAATSGNVPAASAQAVNAFNGQYTALISAFETAFVPDAVACDFATNCISFFVHSSNVLLNAGTCPHTINAHGTQLNVYTYFLCAAEQAQPFNLAGTPLLAARSSQSIAVFPKGVKTAACSAATSSVGPSGLTVDQCRAAVGAFLFQGVGKVVTGGAGISVLPAFSAGASLATAPQMVNQGLIFAGGLSVNPTFLGTVLGAVFPGCTSKTYDDCTPMRQAIDATLVGPTGACNVAKSTFVTAKLELPACTALVENLGGALQKDAASIAVVSRALAKYKFMGTIAGACAQTGGSALGGGDCWVDADCSGHGVCSNLTQAVPLTKVGVFATILLTNSPNGTVGLMRKSDARFRQRANAPIFLKYQARMDAEAGRRLDPVDFGILGPIPDLSEYDADQILRKWRIAAVESVAEFREANPTLKADVVTADSPENLLTEISEADPKILILGYGLMLLYTFLSCTNWSTDVPAMLNGSRALVGMAGILMVAISVASGLGVSHLMGVQWSAAATQIVPFVMLGLGVSDTFVMLRIWPYYQDGLSASEAAVKALTVAGPPMLLVSATNAGVFAVGVLTAMPVVVNFALQAVIVTIANYLTTNLMLPALLILDYKRMAAGRMDMAPCVHVGTSARAQVASESSGYEMNMFNRCLTPCYAKCLMSIPGKIFVVALSFAFLGAAVYGVDTVAELGLQLADIAPAGSDLANALTTRDTSFGFYTISVITGEADWSRREVQQGLVKIFNDVMATEKVVDASGTPWIQVMMQWGQVSTPDYSNSDTPDKLCNSQNTRTGGACGQFFGCTVITADDSVVNGSIPFFSNTTFYTCLENWINSDLAYEALKPGFKLVDEFAPKGQRKLFFSRNDSTGLYLPFSRGTLFTLGLSTNPDFVQLIEEVRAVANPETTPPSFIIGEPIEFWDQYVSLEEIINRSIGFSLLICFLIIWILLIGLVEGDAGLLKRIFATFWASALTTGIIALTVYEIYGFMAFAGIKISAIPAISIIMSTGVAVEYTAYIAVAFVNGAGTYNQRLEHSLMLMLAPVVDGGVTMFLGVVMLAASPFVFIVKYFFYPWLFIIFFGMFNGIAFLPVVFSLVGPPAVKSGARTEPGSKDVSTFNKM